MIIGSAKYLGSSAMHGGFGMAVNKNYQGEIMDHNKFLSNKISHCLITLSWHRS